ncbi:hypothetical protein [uncultured Nostoc sp.]|uniref:NACHT C-terminal helical domain 2-containing protein n=1 Tax=uncultured Nostoc sp. TaxID=340711 RepID=UPI0035CBD8A7
MDTVLDSHIANDFRLGLEHNLAIDLDLAVTLCDYDFDDLSITFELTHNLEFRNLLEQLREQRHTNDKHHQSEQSYQTHERAWHEQLRIMMIKYRNIGKHWQFNDSQKKVLEQYYDANVLLVNCLNSDCYISREVRQEIEDTLLLSK